MSENKKSLINLVPDSVDNAVKNITDKPTQNMGTTLSDIWYLVFGGISQAAEKRKLKYSYVLQEFEKELKEKISKIPEDKLIEPDIQIVAPALDASKYCVENEILRNMFSNYIVSSINIDTSDFSQPIFIDILKNLTPFECRILNSVFNNCEVEVSVNHKPHPMFETILQILITLNKLNSYGLIKFKANKSKFTEKDKAKLLKYIKHNKLDKTNQFFRISVFESLHTKVDQEGHITLKFKLSVLPITPLGIAFNIVCVE